MNKSRILAGTATAALLLGAGTASAQITQPMPGQSIDTRPPLSQVGERIGTGLDREVEDIELRTQREIAQSEDRARFGLGTVPQGFRGSLALTGFASFGNNDDIFLGAAGRGTIGRGNVSHSFGVAAEYIEQDGEDGNTRVLGLYDLNLAVTEQFYGFGIVRGEYNDNASPEWDVFAGVGPGIQIINQPGTAWRVQAGPGLRYTRTDGDSETELGAIVSSRATFRVAQDMFVSNDTDLLYSDTDTLVTNDLALNSRLAGPLSARVGLRTDWRSERAPGEDEFDNRVTLGVVYSFQ